MPATQTESASCFNCGFPIAIPSDRQEVKCPWCGSIGVIRDTWTEGTTLLFAIIGIIGIAALAIKRYRERG
jgi:predicted RNA-binding Zn-ribbon protein involved in translation (DUF1610 family)